MSGLTDVNDIRYADNQSAAKVIPDFKRGTRKLFESPSSHFGQSV